MLVAGWSKLEWAEREMVRSSM